MPNGGSDNCGSCPFNEVNNGRTGFQTEIAQEIFTSSFCLIRNLKINQTSPLYTYCSNHPHHNPSLIEIPIGPVFINETREIWKPSMDNPEIRRIILHLLESMNEIPTQRYPHGIPIEDMAVFHAGEIRLEAAVPELVRISKFNPETTRAADPFRISRTYTVYHALLALCKILGEEALNFVDEFLARNRRPKLKFWKNQYEQWVIEIAISALETIDTKNARERIVELEQFIKTDGEEASKFS